MRDPDVAFNQTKEAFRSKDVTWSDFWSFRGICFALVLRWLELKSQGKTESTSIAILKGMDFGKLLTEFNIQTTIAAKLKEEIEAELSRIRGELDTLTQILDTNRQVAEVLGVDFSKSWAPTEEEMTILKKMDKAKDSIKDLRAAESAAMRQMSNLFGSEIELMVGDAGTASEQVLRKIMGYTLKLTCSFELKSTKKLFFVEKDWTVVASHVDGVARGAATGACNLFEIGLYGSGAHSIGMCCDQDRAHYTLFDPNYGAFAGGTGTANTFEGDLANLLKDNYPKMNKVVISWLTL